VGEAPASAAPETVTFGWIKGVGRSPQRDDAQHKAGGASRVLAQDRHRSTTGKVVAEGALWLSALPAARHRSATTYVTRRASSRTIPFLGIFAVETSAYSKMTEWPGGGSRRDPRDPGAPQLLGQACVPRLRARLE